MMEFSQSEEDLGGFVGAENPSMEGRKEGGRKKKAETAEQLKELHSDLSNLIQPEAEAVPPQDSSAPETTLPGKVQELQARLVVKDQEIQILEAELQMRTQEMSEKLELVNQLSSAEPQTLLQQKQKQALELLGQLASTTYALELQRKKNHHLQEKNWSEMEALAAAEALIREKLGNSQKLWAQLITNDQEIHQLHTALESRTAELSEKIRLLNGQSSTAAPSADVQTFLLEKEKQASELQSELVQTNNALEAQRLRNIQLRETNWSAMEALSAMQSALQGKLGKVQDLQAQLAVKEQEIQMLQAELETRTRELSESIQPVNTASRRAGTSADLRASSLEKQVSDLQDELAAMNISLDLKRRKNNQLRQKNLSAMEALAASESTVEGTPSHVPKLQEQVGVQDQQIQVQQDEERTQELSENSEAVNPPGPPAEAQTLLLEKEKQMSEQQEDEGETIGPVELPRNQEPELQEENGLEMKALSAATSAVQGQLCKFQELRALLVVKNQTIQMLQNELETTTKKLRDNMKMSRQKGLTHQHLHQRVRLGLLRRRVRCWICRTSWPSPKTAWRNKGTGGLERSRVRAWKPFQP